MRLTGEAAVAMGLAGLLAACGSDGGGSSAPILGPGDSNGDMMPGDPDDPTPGPDGMVNDPGNTDPPPDDGPGGEQTPADPLAPVYELAGGCFTLREVDGSFLAASPDQSSYAFDAQPEQASRFFLKAADLGNFLLFDDAEGYLAAETGPLRRETALQSDLQLLDDSYVSGAEWQPEVAEVPDGGEPYFHLRHFKTGGYLGAQGLATDTAGAVLLQLDQADGCTAHPELSLDAEGEVAPRMFEDGSLYGIVDTHSHMLSNFGFGGAGIFHGSTFHRLGVEHALPDCDRFHGRKGRKDVFGYAFSGQGGLDAGTLLPLLLFGELSEDYHDTEGYPEFTEWPAAPFSPTHQTQYYLWLKRAYMAGLRLVVQHMTTNSAICEFVAGEDYQPVRYSCNDMVGVDRQIEETRNMERYIDAQAGGPGKGFFRIVETPQQAREMIAAGKMAVILGIETSNLFNCYSVPRSGMPTCDEAYVLQQLDDYHSRGVRVMFPVHKYDNAFSAGDGHRNFIELGNFINSGHYSNFVEDCPTDIRAQFDRGRITMGDLNRPRDEYMSEPPVNMSRFEERPVVTLTPHILTITSGGTDGEFCQKTGMTQLGEFLMEQLMLRGMVIEIDHFPARSLQRAYEMLEENDYPAASTHGNNQSGRVYDLGGVSKTGLGRCRAADRKGKMLDRLRDRVSMIEESGGYPAEGFGFDLNGFAGAPGPRFGPRSRCDDEQTDPVSYPFTSYAGDVTFTQPFVGNRQIDFNTEGLAHVGLLPELIEDARRDAESDADLEPLFRSAEGYIRMWERSEARAAELRGD